jgi:hypothetical protein
MVRASARSPSGVVAARGFSFWKVTEKSVMIYMETFTCKKCGEEKKSNEFYSVNVKLKDRFKIYFSKSCKSCELKRIKERNSNNKEELRLKSREIYYKDPEKAREKSKKYRNKNIEKVKQAEKERYQANKEKLQQEGREKYHKNRDYVLAKKKQDRIDNNEEINRKQREYQKQEKYKSTKNKWKKLRKKSDPFYKFKENLRVRIYAFLHGKEKSQSTEKILGCSFDFLKERMESLFQEGMSWENHGVNGWHIDHIIPLSSAKTQEEVEKLCHYTNLQPLWWYDNLSKGKKMP